MIYQHIDPSSLAILGPQTYLMDQDSIGIQVKLLEVLISRTEPECIGELLPLLALTSSAFGRQRKSSRIRFNTSAGVADLEPSRIRMDERSRSRRLLLGMGKERLDSQTRFAGKARGRGGLVRLRNMDGCAIIRIHTPCLSPVGLYTEDAQSQ